MRGIIVVILFVLGFLSATAVRGATAMQKIKLAYAVSADPPFCPDGSLDEYWKWICDLGFRPE